MTGTDGFAIVTAGGANSARAGAVRVEKIRAGNGLHGERRHEAAAPGTVTPCRRKSELHQYETGESEPLWNGPPLTAAFAAQLIGQVLVGDSAPRLISVSHRVQRCGLALDRTA
jgi:hypothetical protein